MTAVPGIKFVSGNLRTLASVGDSKDGKAAAVSTGKAGADVEDDCKLCWIPPCLYSLVLIFSHNNYRLVVRSKILSTKI